MYDDKDMAGGEQYIGSVRLAGTRKITGEELSQLNNHYYKRLALFLVWFFLGPVATFLPVTLAAVVKAAGMEVMRWLDVLLFLLFNPFFILSPLTFWASYKTYIKWRAVRVTAGKAEVRVFINDRHGTHTEEAGPQDEEVVGVNKVELYHDADVVYSVDDKVIKGWNRINVTRAAAVPEGIKYERAWSDNLDSLVRKRAMLPDERKELKTYAMYRKKILPAIGWSYVAMFPLSMILKAFTEPPVNRAFVGALIVIVVATVFVLTFRNTYRLKKDLKSGEIFAYNAHQIMGLESGCSPEEMDLNSYEFIEVLPHSGMLWREGDVPADWRNGCR